MSLPVSQCVDHQGKRCRDCQRTTASICACRGMTRVCLEFDRNGRKLRVRVEGQLTFNATSQQINAALAGLGLVYAPEGMVQPYIAKSRLRWVLPIRSCGFFGSGLV